MAQVVKLKRSSTAGNTPTSGQMVAGELAMNTADGKLFLRDDSDVRPIVTVDNEVTGSINLTGDITASGNISVAGNVGIGTTSPTEKLTVESGILLVTGSGPSGYGFQLDRAGLDAYRLSHLDGGLTVYNVDDTRKEMTFDGSGNVGIGTSSPPEKLTVNGTISGSRIYGSGTTQKHTLMSTNTDAIVEIKPSDTRSGLQPVLLYRNNNNGTANYLMADGVITRFATYDGGTPSDVSGMVSIIPNNTNEAPKIVIGDAGSGDAQLTIGNNILLSNTGSVDSYINAGNVGIGTSSPQSLLHVAGNISASGDLTFNGGPTIGTNDNSSLTIEPEGSLFLGNGNQTDLVKIGRESGGPAGRVEIHANSATIAAKFESSTITFNHPITASSNISASGTVVGSNLSGTNTGNVTLAGSYDYITISGQEITRNQIDLSTDVTGQITTSSITNFPTEVSRSAAAAGFGTGGGGGGAVATYTNGSNDRIITSTGTDGINGEANLTFDGSTLALNGNISSSGASDNFFGGRLVLDNAKYVAGTETGGTTRNILSIDGSDITQVANGNLATNIKGTSISIDNALTLDAGDFTVTNGNVRLFTNNTQITGRTSGGAERDIIGFNASDVVVVGNTTTDEVELTGNTKVVGNLTLDDAVDTTLIITGSVKFRIADATYTYQGELSPLAGSGLTTGEIVHYSGSGWAVADASDTTATKHLGVAVSATDVMIRGYIRNAAFVGLGTGNVIYLSTTAGDATITPPSTAGEYVRVLGYCVDGGSRIIYFNPSQDWIEL